MEGCIIRNRHKAVVPEMTAGVRNQQVQNQFLTFSISVTKKLIITIQADSFSGLLGKPNRPPAANGRQCS